MAAATAPGFIEPMRCQLVSRLPEGDDWQYEIKWDGYRAVGIKERAGCRLFSRNGKSLSADFPNIVAALKELRCRSATVDGEVVVLDAQGRPLERRAKLQAIMPAGLSADIPQIRGLQRTCHTR